MFSQVFVCPRGGLCPGGLCLGGSLSGVSMCVWGSLSRDPPCMVVHPTGMHSCLGSIKTFRHQEQKQDNFHNGSILVNYLDFRLHDSKIYSLLEMIFLVK